MLGNGHEEYGMKVENVFLDHISNTENAECSREFDKPIAFMVDVKERNGAFFGKSNH